MSEDSGGLAAGYLWDISTSWTSAAVGALDTGGSLGFAIMVVDFEEPEQPPAETVEHPGRKAGFDLREAMTRDRRFWELTERGLADLEAKRFRPLQGLTE